MISESGISNQCGTFIMNSKLGVSPNQEELMDFTSSPLWWYNFMKCTTFAPATIVPMINVNSQRNPNPTPKLNPNLNPLTTKNPNQYHHCKLLLEISSQEQMLAEQMSDNHSMLWGTWKMKNKLVTLQCTEYEDVYMEVCLCVACL